MLPLAVDSMISSKSCARLRPLFCAMIRNYLVCEKWLPKISGEVNSKRRRQAAAKDSGIDA